MNGRIKPLSNSIWVMAVHMIRLVAAVDSTDTPGMSLTEINTALDDWVSKHSEWVNDSQEHSITIANSDFDGTEYYVGTYRFELSDAKSNLLQKCEDKLKKKVDWYRLGYHVCDHDESDNTSCPWDDEREWTSKNTSQIPTDIPNFV